MKTYLGIDPGVSGGIALIDYLGVVLATCKMPATERDILTAIGHQMPETLVRCTLERVRSSPQMGVVSSFSFGRGYGGLRMALVAAEIPFDEVTPQVWQKAMGCRTGGDKNVSKRRAQELFPYVVCTHAISDALLLAEYGRRIDQRGPHAAV